MQGSIVMTEADVDAMLKTFHREFRGPEFEFVRTYFSMRLQACAKRMASGPSPEMVAAFGPVEVKGGETKAA